jgi:hypothetical protein
MFDRELLSLLGFTPTAPPVSEKDVLDRVRLLKEKAGAAPNLVDPWASPQVKRTRNLQPLKCPCGGTIEFGDLRVGACQSCKATCRVMDPPPANPTPVPEPILKTAVEEANARLKAEREYSLQLSADLSAANANSDILLRSLEKSNTQVGELLGRVETLGKDLSEANSMIAATGRERDEARRLVKRMDDEGHKVRALLDKRRHNGQNDQFNPLSFIVERALAECDEWIEWAKKEIRATKALAQFHEDAHNKTLIELHELRKERDRLKVAGCKPVHATMPPPDLCDAGMGAALYEANRNVSKWRTRAQEARHALRTVYAAMKGVVGGVEGGGLTFPLNEPDGGDDDD